MTIVFFLVIFKIASLTINLFFSIMATVRKVKRIAVHASLDPDIIELIDEISAARGWSRTQAIRHMVTGLVRSLKKSGRYNSSWFSFNDLEITVKPNVFDKMM